MLPSTDRPLQIRAAELGDCRLLWEWANDPQVRAISADQQPIPWDDHVEWFNARLSSPRCEIYVVTELDGTPLGQVRFEELDEPGAAEVHISVAALHRGRGLGSAVLRLACERYQKKAAVTVVAHIRPANTRSQRTFDRVGFVQRKSVRVRGYEALRWELPSGWDPVAS